MENGYIKIPLCTKIKLYEKGYIPKGLNYQNSRITFEIENGEISESDGSVGYIIREEKLFQGENYKNGMED